MFGNNKKIFYKNKATMNQTTRINQALSILGICSRRDADRLITEGKVFLNNQKVESPGIKISIGDILTVSGKSYTFSQKKETKIWIYYKPVGLVTTHKDEKNRKTVFEDLKHKIKERVISVGRLDLNSEGLLLLTNDSSFSKMAESPATAWKRYYKVRIFGQLTDEVISKLGKGVVIDEIKYAPMEIIKSSKDATSKNSWIKCVLTEGKNREIRKLFAHFNISVNRLIRYQYGSYELGDLKPGEVLQVKPNASSSGKQPSKNPNASSFGKQPSKNMSSLPRKQQPKNNKKRNNFKPANNHVAN